MKVLKYDGDYDLKDIVGRLEMHREAIEFVIENTEGPVRSNLKNIRLGMRETEGMLQVINEEIVSKEEKKI